MLPLALLLAAASASDEACVSCCRAGGLSTCDAALRVYGEGSRIAREVGSWRVTGVWEIGCDGVGVFSPGAVVMLDHPPLGGELLGTVSPLQVHCFQQACARPPGTCVSPADDEGRFFLLECGTGLPADASMLGRPAAPDRSGGTQVVMLDGRPLVVQPVTGGAATSGASGSSRPASTSSYPSTAATSSYPSTASASYPSTSSTSSYPSTSSTSSYPSTSSPSSYPSTASTSSYPSTPSYPPTASAPSAYPPAASAYTNTSAVTTTGPATPTSSTVDAFGAIAKSLPNDPPETCKPPGEAIRAEARRRVDTGDEKRIRKDGTGALQEYRAALTMDVCNAYAWLGIGEIAGEAARPDLAVRALKNTTRLLPGHYGAWTQLGKGYEALRQSQLAAEAYQKALELRPGLQEAMEGWRRTATP